MSQQIQSLWSRRPMLLGVIIACSLGAIALTAAYMLSPKAITTIRTQATLSGPAITTLATETLTFMERGNRASAKGNLFAPVGSNALELFLSARDQQEPGAEHAVLELLPTAILHFDRAVKAQAFDSAERLLVLITRADPKSPVLASLQAKLHTPLAEHTTVHTVAAAPLSSEPRAVARASVTSASIDPPLPATPPTLPRATAIEQKTLSPGVQTAARVSAPVQIEKTPPRLIAAPAPQYPVNAKRAKMEGWVDLRLTLDARGSVASAEVIRSEPTGIFDMAAKRAAKRYRFEVSDQSSVVHQRVQFKIRG